jgi:general secretion pathway protein A
MFTQFYGFEAMPFSRTIAPSDILLTMPARELHARLSLVLRERGIGLVTGEVGSGKSTAVRAYLTTLDPNRHTILQIATPIASPGALYRSLLMTLNQPIPFGTASQTAALRSALADLTQTQRRLPVIVIDEAHLLPHTLIDPLRILLAAQLDSHSLAALILIGQSELKRLLQLAPHAAFAQRVTARCHLDPLPLDATLAYIKHHLKIAGYMTDPDHLFSDDALTRIAEYAQGIPRRINQICTAALIAGAIDKKKIIDDTPVRKAINDLDRD